MAIATATRPRRRRALRALSTVLIAAGLLVLADAGLTVLWKEPVTALQNHLRQNGLRDDLQRLEATGPTALERQALQSLGSDRLRVAFLARSLHRRTAEGDAIGRLKIPRIGTEVVIVKGTKAAALRKGPGTYGQTPLPGVPGTSAIAGHRTTYGAPFRHLDDLRGGDRITVEMPYATLTYRVERTRIVDADAVWILQRREGDQLVLSACHPLFSAAQRIVVFARLSDVVPLGAARGGQGSEKAPPRLSSAPA